MSTKLIFETLNKIFPHWTDKQTSDLTAHIFSKYGNLINTKEDDSAIIELLDITIMKALRSYPINNIMPGLITIMLGQQLVKQKEKEKKQLPFERMTDVKRNAQIESNDTVFDHKKYLEKVEKFEKYVHSSCDLKGKEVEFFKIWMQVIKDDAMPTTNPAPNITEISMKLMDEVFVEVQNKLNISDEYSRKLLSLIRKKFRDKRDDIVGTMSFIPKVDADLEEFKEYLIDQINFAIPSSNELSAYRFSAEELDKMIWLKKLFEENGFSFEPNRFPEVYYDDYDKVKEVFPQIKDGILYVGDFILITPDSLGVYIYSSQNNNVNMPCSATEEGVVVLFKDRIESYCSAKEINSEIVRYVILMHELGHWLSHWAFKSEKNWRYGFQLPNIYMKEALAQLVAYWASESNEIHLKTLTDLSPKNATGKVDANQVYGGYIDLTKYSKVLILKKLVELREYWILKDEFMIDYLKSDFEPLEDWVKHKLNDSPDAVFVDTTLKDAIYGNEDCTEGFGNGLNIGKMIQSEVLKIEWVTLLKAEKNEKI